MKLENKTVVVQPAVPELTEERIVLTLSIHEARILRALFGKSTGALSDRLQFLSPLNGRFPSDACINYAGIATVRGEIRNA